MKKRGISIAAIFIACLFALTIIVFAATVYTDYKAGINNASTTFEELAAHTAESSSIYPCGSKEFIDSFNSKITMPSLFKQLQLEVDGIEVYLYPSIPTNADSVFIKKFERRIIGGDGSKIELSAIIYTLSPSMIFNRVRIAFIVVLAGTLAACILLMYIYLSEAEEKKPDEQAEQKSSFSKPIFSESEENALDPDDIDLPEERPQEETEFEQATPQETETQNSSDDFEMQSQTLSDIETTTDIEETTQVAAPQKAAAQEPQRPAANETAEEEPEIEEPEIEEQEIEEQDVPEVNSDEKGLFSPASGFGWESYLNERVESELVRAASSEQDLSLVIIKIPGITAESNCYKDICKTLLEFFQFKDYIFEYKDDGFAALIQNKNVDSAMESAESLYANIVSVLNKARKNVKPLMGISSRSLRLISVDRLLTEAEQALVHASEDSNSPIVAFRVNPEKYRQYINNQN